MKKGRAIGILTVFMLILAGFMYLAIFGAGEKKTGSAEGIKLGLDLAGGVSITYQVAGEETPSKADMEDTIYKMQQRVENYSSEAQVYQEGDDRINIEIPGVSDANTILEDLGKPGSLVFQNSAGEVVLSGTDVTDARAETRANNMGNNEVMVSLTLTEEGAVKFADATRAAAPTQDIIYIIYDGNVISAPSVNEEITGGSAVITGIGSMEEARNIASTIRIGGLKLELEELRSNVVGAQLGEEAIETSLKAALIGFIILILFLIIVYRMPGIAASMALALYVALMVFLLNVFEITLTLPGIAGIILSIGMAVDANVIIFARIKEELATGKTVGSAMKIGYKRALSAILDGNITTLIAAAVLGIMGTGAIKGFAATLALGIVLSMFTALAITRLLMSAIYALGVKNVKAYGVAKERKNIPITSKKAIYFTVSAALIIAGFVMMGVNQSGSGQMLNFSMEFLGGTSTNVTFNEEMSLEEIDASVVPFIEEITGDGFVQQQKVAGGTQVIFKTRSLSLEERERMNTMFEEQFQVGEEMITTENISSTISSEMRSDAIVAVIVATICMLIYIWFRFKDIRFGASAVTALLHDVLIVLAFYAAAKVSVGTTFIACMLTIVGYSINATIIIFDRIRENLAQQDRKETLKDIVDKSITQTMSRSIFTSLTTFIMVASLYVFGVTSIREFALPLMVGIVCGTYSSVCLTGSLWLVLRNKFVPKKVD